MRRFIFFAVVIALAAVSLGLRASPARASASHEVQVEARQFGFPPALIQVTAGEPVRLVLRSADRVHGFSIPDLKIDVEIPRTGDVVVAFTAPPAGRYESPAPNSAAAGTDK
jgi:heme/copper-type cytochrome/quinol oxidase subunit 2